jgi:hypothetical protein
LPDNTTIRKYIRHPADVPIQIALDWTEYDFDESSDPTLTETLTNVSLGGLSFISPNSIELLERVRICIPILDQDHFLIGNVVWCEKSKIGYEIGLEFERTRDIFRVRMIEQICHIEHYRKEVARVEGRELNTQEAAKEWIAKYAGEFPPI